MTGRTPATSPPGQPKRRAARLAWAASWVLSLLLPAAPAVARSRAAPPPVWVEWEASRGRPQLQDLEVRAGGRRVEVEGLEPLAGRWRVVLGFDLLFSDDRAVRNGSLTLAERARALTRLGGVEVVLADVSVRTSFPSSRDPEALAQALGWIAVREGGRDAQARLRRAFTDAVAEAQGTGARPPDSASDHLVELATSSMAEETALLESQRRALVAWIDEQGAERPGVLLLVTAGFDATPEAFYRTVLRRAGRADLMARLEAPPVSLSLEALARVAAAYGWILVPLLPPPELDLPDAALPDAVRAPDLQDPDRYVGGFDPRKLFRGKKKETSVPLRQDPLASLATLAGQTGGSVIRRFAELDPVLASLADGWRLRLGPVGDSGDEPLPLEVRHAAGQPGGGEKLTASPWVASAPPLLTSEVKVRRLLDETLDEGELTVFAVIRQDPAASESDLVVQLDTSALPDPARVRATVGIGREPEPLIYSRRLSGLARRREAGAGLDGGDATLVTIPLVEVDDEPVVVLVEDLDSGRWGGAFAAVVAADSLGLSAAGTPWMPAPKPIHLLAPREAMVTGRTRLDAIAGPRVRRVEFFLDGRPASVRTVPPWSAVFDLGKLPHARRVEAVAYDTAGREVGRDVLVLNEGTGSFRVRIIEPRQELVRGPEDFLTGPVDVGVEVRAPRGSPLDRVEFYWNTSLVAVRFAKPFRQRIFIPADRPKGFVRVVGYLDDGTSSEDVVFLNGVGRSERVEVSLVELFVVVTDRQGRPVQGLTADDFRVLEEGEEQEISSFGAAAELPLTVGMAVDASLSMFIKLPEVRGAVARFVRGLEPRRDRAFLVAFGDEPRLTQDTTGDLGELVRALDTLRPNGRTAIWKSIVYSLVQLQGVPGRKALVVYSDGADEDEDFSFRTCLQFARRVGVPVYVILSNNEIRRTGGASLTVKPFLGRLEKLTEAVGGRVYLSRVGEDLTEVYEQIEQELRSQYMITYYPGRRSGGTWRALRVEVARPGLRVRTISGYYPSG